MAVRVAYGKRENIGKGIDTGIVPAETIIITDGDQSELFYYDKDGKLKPIAEKNRFESFTEAMVWAKTYPCSGHIFSIHNGASWLPYIVNDDNSLSPLVGGTVTITEVNRIDGGSAFRETK